jgi:hypothetical protein
MKLIAVNGRKWSKGVMRAALRASLGSQQMLSLLAENAEYISTYQVDYHGGEQYPHLVRNDAQPDLLNEIIQPMAASR